MGECENYTSMLIYVDCASMQKGNNEMDEVYCRTYTWVTANVTSSMVRVTESEPKVNAVAHVQKKSITMARGIMQLMLGWSLSRP